MGLIRDGIGKALGAGQVQTGFNGPKNPFSSNNTSGSTSSSQPIRRLPPKPDNQLYSYEDGRGPRDSLDPRYDDGYSKSGYSKGYDYDSRRPTPRHEDPYGSSPFSDPPPAYGTQRSGLSDDYYQNATPSQYNPAPSQYNSYTDPSRYDQRSSYQMGSSRPMQNSGFRPLALPQVEYGDGKPFLRGYSDELRAYGIEERQFIAILDQVNKAIVPNPENVIFQKAANIAGWFVPGSASIGLMAGQFAVGIGTAFGHVSMIAKTLSKANLDLFIPRGLEICIGQTKDVDKEAGVGSTSQGFANGYDPEQRVAQYGNAVARLSTIYPREEHIGRQDPIAMLGRGIGARDNQRKMRRAGKEQEKGRRSRRGDEVEGGLKWLMVRKATPDSIAHWQQTLKQSEQALADEQAQANRR